MCPVVCLCRPEAGPFSTRTDLCVAPHARRQRIGSVNIFGEMHRLAYEPFPPPLFATSLECSPWSTCCVHFNQGHFCDSHCCCWRPTSQYYKAHRLIEARTNRICVPMKDRQLDDPSDRKAGMIKDFLFFFVRESRVFGSSIKDPMNIYVCHLVLWIYRGSVLPVLVIDPGPRIHYPFTLFSSGPCMNCLYLPPVTSSGPRRSHLFNAPRKTRPAAMNGLCK